MNFRLLTLVALSAVPMFAQTSAGKPPNPVVMVIILGAIALLPFVAIMLTSFVKLSIVLATIKSALGTQEFPPSQVTNGLAFVLTLFIMAPVAVQMYEKAGLRDTGGVFAMENLTALYDAANRAKGPLRRFLLEHAHAPDRALFLSLAQRLDQSTNRREGVARPSPAPLPAAPDQPANADALKPDEDFRIVVPAFVTTELKTAFQVCFLILLPFLVLDVVVANVVVALGLSMIQPQVISLPLKLLLFVVADGWTLIIKGLILSYT